MLTEARYWALCKDLALIGVLGAAIYLICVWTQVFHPNLFPFAASRLIDQLLLGDFVGKYASAAVLSGVLSVFASLLAVLRLRRFNAEFLAKFADLDGDMKRISFLLLLLFFLTLIVVVPEHSRRGFPGPAHSLSAGIWWFFLITPFRALMLYILVLHMSTTSRRSGPVK